MKSRVFDLVKSDIAGISIGTFSFNWSNDIEKRDTFN